MHQLSRDFYSFLGFHSFLIGLFPFFLPVYLVNRGVVLADVCLLLGYTGAGFCLALWLWDRGRTRLTLRALIVSSFVAELLLVATLFISSAPLFLICCGLLNGVYNCCFWIIQRLLFLDTISPENSGKKFGNFQIFVLVVLKVGVIVGGLVLERQGYLAVWLFSALVALAAILFFLIPQQISTLSASLREASPLRLGELVRFRDRCHSRTIFALDGIFLFFESYFWLITLFVLVRRSFWHLGLLVVVLGLVFGALFILIKNSIDRAPRQRIYLLAVALYGVSWLMRCGVGQEMPLPLLGVLLITISFCTSFFRLAFNKRFFDLAQATSGHRYLFFKSYFSQFFLALFFMSAALFLPAAVELERTLNMFYLAAAALSTAYAFYAPDGGG